MLTTKFFLPITQSLFQIKHDRDGEGRGNVPSFLIALNCSNAA